MKANIHPAWYPEAKVFCRCGNTFTVGSTVPEIKIEVCYNCHPFYTGTMKFIDTAGRVDAFNARQKSASSKILSKSEKRRLKKSKKIQEELAKPDSLAELRDRV